MVACCRLILLLATAQPAAGSVCKWHAKSVWIFRLDECPYFSQYKPLTIASFTYKQWLLSIVQNVPRTNKHLRYITTWHDSMSYNHFLYSHRHFWFPAVVQNIWLEEYEEHVVLIICMNNNGYPASKIVTCTGGICISWSEMNCSIMELAFSYTRYVIFMWIVDSLWCHLIVIARQFK